MKSEPHRVFQLIDLIENRADFSAYFQNFEQEIEELGEKRIFWLAREKELQRLDQEAWASLKNKVLPFLTARDHYGRGWQQLIDMLNERLGYIFLLDLGCTEIRFISEKNGETPELEAKLDGEPVICEVKTINISEEEVEFRVNGAAKASLASLESEFFIKLRSTLEKAKSQMVSHNNRPSARHIAFVIINFDDSLGEYKTDYYGEIDSYLGCNLNFLSEIEVVFFNKRTPFHNDVHMKNATVINDAG